MRRIILTYRDHYEEYYGELLCKDLPYMNHVTDKWPNYEKVKQMIDKRYRDWKRPAPLSNLTV